MAKIARFPLRQHPDFFKTASVFRTKHWTVFYSVSTKDNKDNDEPQIELTVRVSKKAARLSVERHKITRRTREAWRAVLGEYDTANKNIAVTIFPTKTTLSNKYSDLVLAAKKTVLQLFEKNNNVG